MLFYGLPCLYGVLPAEYFQHFVLLVEAVYLLLQDSISQDDLKKASVLLKHFCINMAAIYGKRYETSNIHMLVHLVEKVRDLGPLWCNSCFYFEDFNGELRRLFHGTQKIEQQITLAVCINQWLSQMESCLQYGTSASVFYGQLTQKKKANHRKQHIVQDIFSVGAMTCFKISGADKTAVEKLVGPVKENVYKFKRIVLQGDLVVHSKDYQPVVKRNNYTVYVKEEDGQSCFCQIKYYLKVFAKCRNAVFCGNSCSCTVPHYLAVANKLEKAELQLSSDTITHASAKHIIPVKRGGLYVIAFPLTCICKVCVFVSCDNVTDFVCHVPNRVEKE